MLVKIRLLLHTVKYLKPVQVYYRLYYFARRRVRKMYGFTYPLTMTSRSVPLTLQPSISSYTSIEDETFSFLNLSHTFDNNIDWNFSQYGKLWTYNLSYFDYLQQEKMSREEGLRLMYDFMGQSESHKDALEPFPVSLRGINWVKFLTAQSMREKRIDDSLYAQYNILMDNLEYHLLGNHLLENGFSLLFGAYYFQDERFYAKAKKILTEELEEQILDDGAHFELSPMYHQIMLFRVLDCLNLVKNNGWKDKELLELLTEKAEKMLGWLAVMSYEDGSIPLFNDSANGIAPTTMQLNDYAERLKVSHPELDSGSRKENGFRIKSGKTLLRESGYRKINKEKYECIVDIGNIGPDYIPGHAHADTFNFELHIKPIQHSMKVPFIVDTGLSTYETNERRTQERSTAAHNTVEVMGTSSSEVWGGFRVADRAYVSIGKESSEVIVATHDGYKKQFGTLHTRAWRFEDDKIVIKDSLNKKTKAIARLHFHPDVTEAMIREHIVIQHCPTEMPLGATFNIQHYSYAPEFNTLVDALVLEVEFDTELETIIQL